MPRLIKCLPVFAALVAASAFAAPPEPHHPEAPAAGHTEPQPKQP